MVGLRDRGEVVTSAKLWESEHEYYCNDNFYSSEPKWSYASWAAFADEELKDIDDDYNFLFRWDWLKYDPDDDRRTSFDAGETPTTGSTDQYLKLFYMGQRKGLFRVVTVYNLSEADEPAVREFLRARWQYMRGLWEPISSEGTLCRTIELSTEQRKALTIPEGWAR